MCDSPEGNGTKPSSNLIPKMLPRTRPILIIQKWVARRPPARRRLGIQSQLQHQHENSTFTTLPRTSNDSVKMSAHLQHQVLSDGGDAAGVGDQSGANSWVETDRGKDVVELLIDARERETENQETNGSKTNKYIHTSERLHIGFTGDKASQPYL